MRIVPVLTAFAALAMAQAAAAQRVIVVLPASARTVSRVVILQPLQPIKTEERMRPRATGSMVDIYPIDGTGFHLSGGLRFFSNRSYLRETAHATRDLLYLPRTPGNPGNRWGYRRTPSMALGYTQTLDNDMFVGLEVGTIMGRATSANRRFGPRGLGRHGPDSGGPNSIVHFDFGVRF